MSLRERLQKPNTPANQTRANQAGSPTHPGQPTPESRVEITTHTGNRFEELKSVLHNRLVDNLNLVSIEGVDTQEITAAAFQFLEQLITQEKIPMSRAERDIVVRELVEEIVGYGPLEPLLQDPSISEIMINGAKNVYIERDGKLFRSNIQFKNDAHLMHIIERIVSAVGRRVDEKTPMVDARLKDGSRFNAIIPPLALDGPSITIRKFKQDAGNLDKLLGWGALSPAMALTLEGAVKSHLNIIISGGTGSGKTTLLNSLSALINDDERIVTIEDSAELQLKQEHVVRLETRPANIEGEGAVQARQLLINALRMRPDRIIVGECRSGETLDMLQAMNTGHDGSLTTLHSNSPRDAISRIETMSLMNENPLPEKAIRQQISSAVHLIIQVSRLQDGSRKCTSICEVTGMEGDIITMQEIFKFYQEGIDENGKVIGRHMATGVRPRFADLCKSRGIHLPNDIFLKSTDEQASPPGVQPSPPATSNSPSITPFNPEGFSPQRSSHSTSETASASPALPNEGQNLRDILRRREGLQSDLRSGFNRKGPPE